MDIIEVANKVEQLLNTWGSDGYEIMTGHSRSLSIEAKEGKIDTFRSAEPVGVGIRVMKGGGIGFSFSTSMARVDLDRMIEGALVGANTQSPDPWAVFPGPASYRNLPELFDPELAAIDVSAKTGLALELERLTLAADSRIRRVRKATYGETTYSVHLRNSHGLRGDYCGTSVSASVAALAAADGDNQMGWDFAYGTRFQELDIHTIARSAAERSISMLGARTIPTMQSPVVLDNRVAAEFLELLAPSFSAENLHKGKSLLKGKEGAQLFPSLLTIRDDGTLPGGMATSPFDGEGVPHQSTQLVTAGKVNGFLYDSRYGKIMGKSSTGNSVRGGVKGIPHLGVSNFFIVNGEHSMEKLLSGISRGMVISGLIGMHTANPVSGDFSVGATGFLVENGTITMPVKGVAISGNILELFHNIEMTGNDLRFYSSVGAPALKIGSLDISGE